MRCPSGAPNGAAARVAAQHSQNYGSWYAHLPGLIVICPYSAADAKGLLKAAIRTRQPGRLSQEELLYGQHFEGRVPLLDDYTLPDRQGADRPPRAGRDDRQLLDRRRGHTGRTTQELVGTGISAEVIDLRTLRPLDKAMVLESLKRTNRMVVVEEGWPVCWIHSEIIAIAMTEGFDDLDVG